jgi:2-keto-4-pentenoate hydratase
MTPQDAEKAAELLDAARRNATQVQGLDARLQPRSIEDAYAIQAAVARRHGGAAGWKIMAIVPAQREALKVDRPIAAPVFKTYCAESPARLALKSFIAPMLECEFDYVLGRDLPARDAPYSAEEVLAAVSVLRPAIEVVDSRVGRPAATPLMLADCFSNGALVLGRVCDTWRSLDLLKQGITLKVDGNTIMTGDGAKIPGGGPVHALVTLANNPPPWAGGLKAGQVVTTGSCTGMPPLGGGREVVADFGALGEVRIDFA